MTQLSQVYFDEEIVRLATKKDLERFATKNELQESRAGSLSLGISVGLLDYCCSHDSPKCHKRADERGLHRRIHLPVHCHLMLLQSPTEERNQNVCHPAERHEGTHTTETRM